MNYNQPDIELQIVEPEILNWQTYASPFLYEQRIELPCVGNEQAVTITNAVTKKFKFQVPGGNRHSKHRIALKYDLVAPRSGPAGAYSANKILCMSATEVAEIGSFKYKVSNQSSNWVDIPDVAQYSHEQSIASLDYKNRSEKDRLFFPSGRIPGNQLTAAQDQDPRYSDPFYSVNGNTGADANGYTSNVGINGGSIIYENTHANLIAFDRGLADPVMDAVAVAYRTHSFEVDLKDFAPNTAFELNLMQLHNADDLYEIEFKRPTDFFFIKDSTTADGLFRQCLAADISSYQVNNIKLVYYNGVTYDKDDDDVLSKIDDASYTFFYPHPEPENGTFSSSTGNAQKQDLMINLTSSNGICIYKMFAHLYKDDSVNGLATTLNSCNFISAGFTGAQQKYNHVQVVGSDAKVQEEYYANDFGLQKMVKNACNWDNSLTNEASFQNWGGLLINFDSERMPKDPYNPQVLRGHRLTTNHHKIGFRLNVLPPKLALGGDNDNPNARFRYSVNAIVFKKAVILKGDISY